MENIFGEWRKLNEKRESLEIRNKYLKAASRIQRELNANLLFIYRHDKRISFEWNLER